MHAYTKADALSRDNFQLFHSLHPQAATEHTRRSARSAAGVQAGLDVRALEQSVGFYSLVPRTLFSLKGKEGPGNEVSGVLLY